MLYQFSYARSKRNRSEVFERELLPGFGMNLTMACFQDAGSFPSLQHPFAKSVRAVMEASSRFLSVLLLMQSSPGADVVRILRRAALISAIVMSASRMGLGCPL